MRPPWKEAAAGRSRVCISNGSSGALGGTVDADEGGPHARPGQVPDQEQVDEECDRIFIIARDDGNHVRSQGHDREEHRDLPGPRLEGPKAPGHDEAEDTEEDQDRSQSEGAGLALDVDGRGKARGDHQDEAAHEQSEGREDLQDREDRDAPRPATDEPSEILLRGHPERAEAQGGQEDQDDREGDEVGRLVEVVHLTAQEISHLVDAQTETSSEEDGGDPRQVARRVLDRDPGGGADEYESVEEVVDMVAVDDEVPAEVRGRSRGSLGGPGEENEASRQGKRREQGDQDEEWRVPPRIRDFLLEDTREVVDPSLLFPRLHVPNNAVLDLQDSPDRRVCLRNGRPRPNTAEGHDRSSGMRSQKMAPSSGYRRMVQFNSFRRSFSASPASSRTISRAGFTPFTPPTPSPAN